MYTRILEGFDENLARERERDEKIPNWMYLLNSAEKLTCMSFIKFYIWNENTKWKNWKTFYTSQSTAHNEWLLEGREKWPNNSVPNVLRASQRCTWMQVWTSQKVWLIELNGLWMWMKNDLFIAYKASSGKLTAQNVDQQREREEVEEREENLTKLAGSHIRQSRSA